MSTSPLHALADACGLLVDWVDVAGQPRVVEPDTLRALLAGLGLRADDERQCRDSLRALAAQPAHAPLRTARIGEWLVLPAAPGTACEWQDEDGRRLAARVDADTRVQAPAEPGYWQLSWGGDRLAVAVAPQRCWSVADACRTSDPHAWGLALQVYSAGSEDDAGIGDAAGASEWLRLVAHAGADALALSPLHAPRARHGGVYSPYSPSDRRFLDPLQAAPTHVLGPGASAALMALPSLRERFAQLQAQPLIDWNASGAAKWQWLRTLHDRFDGTDDGLHADFLRFREEGGTALADYARFAARDHGDDDPGLHLFAQWLAQRSWSGLQREARERGMGIGLIADLAVGFDPAGAEAVAWPQAALHGLVLGAPPDAFNPDGQVWGIASYSPRGLRETGYAPFVQLLRAVLRDRGGLRIDHILGLLRLWLVPAGAAPGEGGYLRYPLHDLLNLLALESWRHRAIVIGEDLGVVPPGLREDLASRGVLGTDVLLFSRDEDGRFLPPGRWRRDAVATSSTHDLPTLCGWRAARDLDWRERLGLGTPAQLRQERTARRAAVVQLRAACGSEGVAEGDPWLDALRYTARAPGALALLPAEDALALGEQPNLPGTVATHPNWRRRLPQPLPVEPLQQSLLAFADARHGARTEPLA
ncbi:4-alpha-glucanotransferase [Stenotrophomonas sp. HITSZ_GD]|uniref:4-alpha-glucanotransferase n=1 Tax=Stenotrophomonas sp. HITSZ_GD TaxID=3037248 RepID=UPI00240D1465|nr:4-alpha-glucanotransferase [Stenotrophomonas sp. HITSZ_GD]MDG2526084.1 4-alpha-glucanotransferase [Stenotrophomonas sp. HITSZ_GD]